MNATSSFCALPVKVRPPSLLPLKVTAMFDCPVRAENQSKYENVEGSSSVQFLVRVPALLVSSTKDYARLPVALPPLLLSLIAVFPFMVHSPSSPLSGVGSLFLPETVKLN